MLMALADTHFKHKVSLESSRLISETCMNDRVRTNHMLMHIGEPSGRLNS